MIVDKLDEMKPVYFPGLNGIRAIAALVVFFWHIDQFSYLFNIQKLGFSENGMAGYGVNIFFVLSVFLITYLLLKEKNKFGSVDIKKFYIRRILRIWPLYYLTLIFAMIFIALNIIEFPINLNISVILYAFFAANFAYALSFGISVIIPLWSVGVEEQFYVFWPHFVAKVRNLKWGLVLFIVSYLFLKITFYFFIGPSSVFYEIISLVRFDLMAMGGIGALIIFYEQQKITKWIFSNGAQLISWTVLISSIFYKPIHLFSIIDAELNAIFYIIIILNVSSNTNSKIKLESKFFNFFGKISYGIYVYHMLIIYALASINRYLNINNFFTLTLSLFAITTLTSYISYNYFEILFLKRKHNFSRVISTDTISN